jgi:hypothetical protein
MLHWAFLIASAWRCYQSQRATTPHPRRVEQLGDDLAKVDFWQLSLAFRILDVVLFEKRMGITCINNFSVYVRDKCASVLSPEMLAYHKSLERKSLHEHVRCGLMTRIEMHLLNHLMGTTAGVHNTLYSGAGIESTETFQYVIFHMHNRLTAVVDSLESRVANSQRNRERHALFQLI